MNRKKIIEKAKTKTAQYQKLLRDPRYLKVMGKLKHEGLIDVRDAEPYRGQVFLEDAIWAGQIEPKIFELLPAILMRRPALFAFVDLPIDLRKVVGELRAGRAVTPYQGVEPTKYGRWVSLVGRTDSIPKVTRTFRLSENDLERLTKLSKLTSHSLTEVFQKALIVYEKSLK